MKLAVVCSHFNPAGFHAPRRNILRFLRQLGSRRIPVFVSELAYGDASFFLPTSFNVLRFRTDAENVLWHKENLINLAAESIISEFDVIAWIDPDLLFLSEDWTKDACAALETYAAVQLFSMAYWTDKDGRCYKRARGTVADASLKLGKNHPGFAWAARKELWKEAGGLCEHAILGGGDALFAAACLGEVLPEWMYYPDWKAWTLRQSAWVRENGGIGFVPGGVVHEWHGFERDRSYVSRHSLVRDIDLSNDVLRGSDGVVRLVDRVSIDQRRAISNYFLSRREDD